MRLFAIEPPHAYPRQREATSEAIDLLRLALSCLIPPEISIESMIDKMERRR